MRSLLHAPRTRKRSIAAATLAALALIGSFLVATPAQALNDTGTGGVFVPATGRILDTKAGTGGFSTPMEAGKYRTIKVAGLAGLPDDGSVGAVSLNATVGASTGYGTLFGRPDADTGRTTMLIYNGVSGEYTSNSATLAVGSDGTIQVMTETASRLILDVQGYYTANTDGTAAGGFVPVAKRLVDTRSGTGAAKAAIAPGKSIDVQITGANGVPAGASAAVVNLIAVNSTDADGYLTPYATGGTKPQNSLHYAPSETTSMQAQVPLSAAGKITIANSSTTTNLLVDIQGYFTAAGKGGAVFTPSYGRAYDSRASGNTALAKNEVRSIQIAGTAGVPVMGSGITAVTLTLIVAHGGSAGYADVYADGKTNPGITAVNFQPNEIQTNTITVPLGANGKIALRNAAEATNYVVDVQGWYTNPAAPRISCPTPYQSGAWVAAIPEDDISCSVTTTAATFSGEQVRITLDDDEYSVTPLSETSTTSQTVAVPAVGGAHTIIANRVDANDATTDTVSSAYSFTLGDWANETLNPTPPSPQTAGMTPTLDAVPENDTFGSDVQRKYTLSANPDGATDPIIATGWTSDPYPIPAGVLTDGATYYWTLELKGTAGGRSGISDVLSPVWTFTASSAADTAADAMNAEDEANAPDDDDTGSSASRSAAASSSTDSTNSASDWSIGFGDGERVSFTDGTAGTSAQSKAAAVREYHSVYPECPDSAKAGHVVKNLSRAGAYGAPGHKAHLSCGKGSPYYDKSDKRGDYGMRHIAGKHGRDFDRPIRQYPQAFNGASWKDLMYVTLDHTLRAPGNGVSYNAKADNFNYNGPLDVYYKNKKVHSYKALVAVSNGNWAVVTAYAQ
ncbi:hypothetical protein ACRQ4C_01375 [Curtobacterium sp. SP.BCp]|uniref:hypothetical protein n=1 Tax=Curtobacterium sp. SP.BCp TaxID=3435230 RepID=UPI003F735433